MKNIVNLLSYIQIGLFNHRRMLQYPFRVMCFILEFMLISVRLISFVNNKSSLLKNYERTNRMCNTILVLNIVWNFSIRNCKLKLLHQDEIKWSSCLLTQTTNCWEFSYCGHILIGFLSHIFRFVISLNSFHSLIYCCC